MKAPTMGSHATQMLSHGTLIMRNSRRLADCANQNTMLGSCLVYWPEGQGCAPMMAVDIEVALALNAGTRHGVKEPASTIRTNMLFVRSSRHATAGDLCI